MYSIDGPIAKWLKPLSSLPRVIIGSSHVLRFNPRTDTCETCQILIAGAPGGLSQGSRVFAFNLLIGPSQMSGNNLERDVNLN